MTADLTNQSGVEIQFKFLWQGHLRYVNLNFVPVDTTTTWDLTEVMDTIENDSGWVSNWADAAHVDCLLMHIQGRVRGRPDAGTTMLYNVNQAGLKAGTPTPSWITASMREYVDNTAIDIVNPPSTPFRYGRMGFPGVVAEDMQGNQLDASATTLWDVFANSLLSIPAGVTPNTHPEFGLIIVRHRTVGTPPNTTRELVQRGTIFAIDTVGVGSQQTAR